MRLVLPEDYILAQCYIGPVTTDVFRNRGLRLDNQLTLSKDITSARGIVLDAVTTGNSESCDVLVATADKNESGPVAGENELARVDLSGNFFSYGCTVTLQAGSGGSNIAVWTTRTKGTQIVLPKTYTIGTDTIPSSVYVEGLTAGEVMLELVAAGTGLPTGYKDSIKLTVRDDLPPHFTNITAVPPAAKSGDTVSIKFTASEALVASPNPTVTVNGNSASYSSKSGNDYTYSYTVGSSPAG